MKQKRQTGASGMVQASNLSAAQLTSHSTKWLNANKELHGDFLPFFLNKPKYFNKLKKRF